MSKRRSNPFTSLLQDLVDDTKAFVDDMLDRTKSVESNVKDTTSDVVDDEA